MHGHCFPPKEERETPEEHAGTAPQPNEPTSTPDLLLKTNEQEEQLERSERITAGDRIVPPDDETERLEDARPS